MTHKQRVLELLSDGRPHSYQELYGLHVIAHSRVADLRADGHDIVCWRDGDLYLYRLLDAGEAVCGASLASSGLGDPGVDEAAHKDVEIGGDGVAVAQATDGQLTFAGSSFRRSAAA